MPVLSAPHPLPLRLALLAALALTLALMVLPVTLFFWYSSYAYFPGHIRYLTRRYAYYVYGDETVDLLACARAHVAEWVNIAWLWLCSVLGTSPRVEL